MVALLYSQTHSGGLCRKAELWRDSLCHCKTILGSSNSPLHLTIIPLLQILPQSFHTLTLHPPTSLCTHTKIGNYVWAEFLFLLNVLFSSFLPHSPLFPPRRFPHQDTGKISTTELLQPPPPVQLCAHWLNATRSRSRPGCKNSTLITVIKVRVPNSSKDSWAV